MRHDQPEHTITALHLAWYPAAPRDIRGSIHIMIMVPKCPMFDFDHDNDQVPELARLLAAGFHKAGHSDGRAATVPLGSITKASQPVTLEAVLALQTARYWAARGLEASHHTCQQGPVCEQQDKACEDEGSQWSDPLPECRHQSCLLISHDPCTACYAEAWLS